MFESILLVLALSLDGFVASIAYGTNKIKIPYKSIIIINMVCSSFLTASLFFGCVVKKIISPNITSRISFLALMILGIYYLFESIVKNYLNRNWNKKLKVNLFNIKIIVDIYVDETKADFNNSKDLSSKEALYLATALSLDSLAVGFGSSLGNINYVQVIIFSLVLGMIVIPLGLFIGKKFSQKSKVNLSWLSGILLIILSILRLI